METATRSAAGAFVERFAAAWADASPERLDALLHDDVRLVQPLLPEVRGRAAARRMWDRLFRRIPDLRAEVLSWAAESDEVVFIRIRLSGTALRRPIAWTAVDRIVLEHGLVRERVSHFDPLAALVSWVRG